MAFTKAYYKYGYNVTLEKVAKKKKDEGMSTGAKIGLGAAGIGAAGLGAYYGGDMLKELASKAQESLPPGQAGHDVYSNLGKAGDWANQNLKAPMDSALDAGSEYALDAKKAIVEGASKAGEKASEYKDQAADFIKNLKK